MAFYHVGCGFSDLHIKKGNKIRFIPLLGNRDVRLYNDGVAPAVLFEPTSLFYPLCFPIECRYDGLGGVKDIKRTVQTKALEDYFGIKIGQICKLATCNRNASNSYSAFHQMLEENDFSEETISKLELLKGLSGMFVLEEVYQMMISNFELNKVNVEVVNNYNDEFVRLGEEYFVKMAELDQKVKDNPELQELYDSIEYSYNPLYKGNGYNGLIPVEKWIYFRDIFGKALLKGELKDELFDQWCVYYTMQQVNLIFKPCHSSYSEVSHKASLLFLEGVTEVAKKRTPKKEL